MLCDNCKSRPANVHLTKIINDERMDIHLCDVCAKETTQFEYEYPFSLNNFLASLLDVPGYSIKDAKINQTSVNKCSLCGLTFDEFKNNGKFGCSECYSVFSDKLIPILKRLHGSIHHSGKLPQRAGGAIKVKKEIEKLRMQLNKAISLEEYEKAAELRDKIKELEKTQLDR